MVAGVSGRPEKDGTKILQQNLTAGLYNHIPGSIDQTGE